MKPAWRAGNRIELLDSGHEYFPALLAALAAARAEILLETYIYANDAAAGAVTAALCAAARRGVRVHVLADGFGARNLPQRFRADFAAAGVELRFYRPPVVWRWRHGLRRLHRKIVAIDGADTERAVAFVGGINVIDDEDTPGEVPPRRDFAVSLKGPLVADVREAARRLWRTVAGLPRRDGPPSAPPAAQGVMRAALVLRDNLLHRRDIEQAYAAAIGRARARIVIACAYFLPSRRLLRALTLAARRGVAVTLLLQGPSDHPVLQAAGMFLYRRLLGAGVAIVEYRKSFLHAKVAVVDGDWATVGSSNIDPFSLLLAREANVVVTDAEFAAGLAAALERLIAAGGVPVGRADLRRAPWWTRAGQWLAFRFARAVISLLDLGGTRPPA